MLATQRQAAILGILSAEGSIAITDLAKRLGVSFETARRDVKPLVASGVAARIHGGISLPKVVGEAPFDRRMRENSEAKRAIARAVAATIRSGESVMFDTGTTTSFVARELMNHSRLTVVTNSSDIARQLATVNGNAVYMAGGALRSDSGAALGLSAIEFVSRFWVDHVIISAGALHDKRGILDFDLEEAEFARSMLGRGQRRVLVCDHAKTMRPGLVQVCDWNGIDAFYTDRHPGADIAAGLEQNGVALHVAPTPGEAG